jgi:hypothetical protein
MPTARHRRLMATVSVGFTLATTIAFEVGWRSIKGKETPS